MANLSMNFYLDLPEWATEFVSKLPEHIPSIEDRMRLIHDLANLNFRSNTGGPFAAGVFESESGRIVSIGVNRVMSRNCSSAHAEIMAISLAQKNLGVYDLGGNGMPKHDLVVNWLPCAMCFGALLWSGCKRLVIAGNGPELEEITTFDEGPRPENWEEELRKRGIETLNNILRHEAIATFEGFRQANKIVYNARQST